MTAVKKEKEYKNMNQKADNIHQSRVIILILVLMMVFMATLDMSIVNVALPVMSKKLSVSTKSISWVVTAYLIVIVATTLIFGRLGDLKGKAAVFKFGIFFFTLGSLICGISNSLIFLVVCPIHHTPTVITAAGGMSQWPALRLS